MRCGFGSVPRAHTILRAAISVLFFVRLLVSTGICDDKPIVFPLPHFDEILLVPVTISDEEYLFVLDTGASANAFDSSLQHLLGDPIREVTIRGAKGGKSKARVCHPPIATLGTILIARNAKVYCLDLSVPRSALGRELKGILGMPFFITNIIQVDFDQREIRVLPLSTKPTEAWGEPIEVAISENNIPIIQSKIGDSPNEPCMVDTGFSGTLSLRSEVYEYLLQMQAISPAGDVHTATLGETSKSIKGVLSGFTIDGYVHKKLFALQSKAGLSRIGLNYLRRYLEPIPVLRPS